MKLAGIAFTERGARLLERLLSRFQEEGEETEGTVSPSCAEAAGGLSMRRETLKEWMQHLPELQGSGTRSRFFP